MIGRLIKEDALRLITGVSKYKWMVPMPRDFYLPFFDIEVLPDVEVLQNDLAKELGSTVPIKPNKTLQPQTIARKKRDPASGTPDQPYKRSGKTEASWSVDRDGSFINIKAMWYVRFFQRAVMPLGLINKTVNKVIARYLKK